jgi:RNA polymerase sigma-70 factor (ECF subfamily)
LELAAEIELNPLVEKCKQGDTRSYSEVYQQYSRAMFSTCYRLLNNISDAEDILQESFTDAPATCTILNTNQVSEHG